MLIVPFGIEILLGNMTMDMLIYQDCKEAMSLSKCSQQLQNHLLDKIITAMKQMLGITLQHWL